MSDRSNTWTFGTIVIFGVTGLLASFILTIDKLQLLAHPDTILSCSINIVLNCTTVMQTWQSSVFGFPNMLLGLMLFPVVVLVGILGLTRTKMPGWFWAEVNVGFALGTLFAYWLFFQSVYAIQVLCPWCLLVTFSCTMLLSSITHYNLRHDTFRFSKSTRKKIHAFLDKDYLKLLTAAWIALLVLLVFLKFGDSLFV